MRDVRLSSGLKKNKWDLATDCVLLSLTNKCFIFHVIINFDSWKIYILE